MSDANLWMNWLMSGLTMLKQHHPSTEMEVLRNILLNCKLMSTFNTNKLKEFIYIVNCFILAKRWLRTYRELVILLYKLEFWTYYFVTWMLETPNSRKIWLIYWREFLMNRIGFSDNSNRLINWENNKNIKCCIALS